MCVCVCDIYIMIYWLSSLLSATNSGGYFIVIFAVFCFVLNVFSNCFLCQVFFVVVVKISVVMVIIVILAYLHKPGKVIKHYRFVLMILW